MPVKITPNGLMATLQTNSEAVNKDVPAKDNALERMEKSARRDGDAYHVELLSHLNKKASSNLFKKYFESEHYKPIVVPVDGNDHRNGIVRF